MLYIINHRVLEDSLSTLPGSSPWGTSYPKFGPQTSLESGVGADEDENAVNNQDHSGADDEKGEEETEAVGRRRRRRRSAEEEKNTRQVERDIRWPLASPRYDQQYSRAPII